MHRALKRILMNTCRNMASKARPLLSKVGNFPQKKMPFESVIARCKFATALCVNQSINQSINQSRNLTWLVLLAKKERKEKKKNL